MKEIILNFWTEADKHRKTLSLKVLPMSTGENPHLFIHRGTWSMFIQRYCVVDDKSSSDWGDYFKVVVLGGVRLHVYSEEYQINMELPVSNV